MDLSQHEHKQGLRSGAYLPSRPDLVEYSLLVEEAGLLDEARLLADISSALGIIVGGVDPGDGNGVVPVTLLDD